MWGAARLSTYANVAHHPDLENTVIEHHGHFRLMLGVLRGRSDVRRRHSIESLVPIQFTTKIGRLARLGPRSRAGESDTPVHVNR